MRGAGKIHFIGIGGAGMSGIAKVLLEMNQVVTGSDIKESRNTLQLRKLGAQIYIGHDPGNVEGAGLVVTSSAIPPNNLERVAAEKLGIEVVPRAEMLARLGVNKRGIAVAGTHGKTTTTSMVALALDKCGLDVTFLIGGELNDIGSNAKYGQGGYMVAEADESDGSLLRLKPEIAVLTNIEYDHMDFYNSFEEIKDVFRRFLAVIPEQGFAVVCGDQDTALRVVDEVGCRFLTYGFDNKNYIHAAEIELAGFGSRFAVYREGKRLGQVELAVPGAHNIYNALAAITLCLNLGLDFRQVADSLKDFSGVQRRFQKIGCHGAVTVVDDYAHHPTEVKVTLKAAKSGDWNRVICIFQPHRFSRTHFLSKDFGQAFGDADFVVLTDVYAADEEPVPGVTGKLIVDSILSNQPDKPIAYLPKKSEVSQFLLSTIRRGDLVLTMGAGDIWSTGEELLELIKNREGVLTDLEADGDKASAK